MFSEMMASPYEHMSRSHCPRLALATPLSKGSIYGYSGASAESLPLGSHSGWPDSQDFALATVGTSLSHLTSPQGLPQKREDCLTQIGMPLCRYSALVCGRHTTDAAATRSEPCLALLSCPCDPRRKNQCQRGEIPARGILT